jgi:aconitate hydratase
LAERFLDGSPTGGEVKIVATDEDGTSKTFSALVRIDTPGEAEYYRHGGILQFVLRRLAAE